MTTYPADLIEDQRNQSEQLFRLITDFINHFKNSQSQRVRSLVIVARRLKIFGCQQIKFFSSPKLQLTNEFPLEYIFSLLHDQIARDFSVIHEAACQRTHADDQSLETFKVADYLGEAVFQSLNEILTYKYIQVWPDFDILVRANRQQQSYGQQAGETSRDNPNPKTSRTIEFRKYAPFLEQVGSKQQKLLPERPVVITYFRKFPSIRLIPYANIALVGIPFTSVYRKKDLLATPHEIGHQVFWRWKELRVAIRNLYNVLPTYAECWAEEIFADTFGVQAVGAAAALFAQDLEAGFDQRHFLRDDGAHPTSVLRPYVHIKALNAENNPIVKDLEAAWTPYRQSRSGGSTHFEGQDGRPIQIDYALGKDLTRHNYSHLEPRFPVDRLVELFLGKIPTGQGWNLQGSIDKLYPDFESYLGNLPFNQPLKEMDQAADLNEIFTLSDKDCKDIPFEDPTWANVVRDYVRDNPEDLWTMPDDSISPQAWLPLMDMDSWTDKGPTSNPRGG